MEATVARAGLLAEGIELRRQPVRADDVEKDVVVVIGVKIRSNATTWRPSNSVAIAGLNMS